MQFKDIALADYQRFKEGASICELSFANLFIWHSFDRAKFTVINNNICILITPANETPYFLEPLGKNELGETVKTCLQHTGKMSRVTESFINTLSLKEHKIRCLRDQFDYVYETKSLAELKGKKYDGKRGHLKKFQKRHPDYTFVPLTKEHENGAMQLFEEWFSAREKTQYFSKLAYDAQKEAIQNAFKYFNELKLLGGALIVDKVLKGFTLGSWLNPETIDVHFLYGHPGLHGVFQTILWEACNKTYHPAKLVNLEQDLGIPGLRKSKLSYHPLRLEKKFEVFLA